MLAEELGARVINLTSESVADAVIEAEDGLGAIAAVRNAQPDLMPAR